MTRRARALALVALALAGTAVALAGALPDGATTVAEAAARAGHGHGGRITVKAAVERGSLDLDADPPSFALTDGVTRLRVLWPAAIPGHEAAGTLEGRMAVVTGRLEVADGETVLVGEEMQVGCASKYERA